MSWKIALRLGRVSNLPTVWTNTLTGIVLAGGPVGGTLTLALLVAMSLFYVGGMYLNDAFDAEIDARERAGRPIPQGAASRRAVFGLGFGMLIAGVLCLATLGRTVAWTAMLLAAAIVLYDWLHKRTALAPLLMALCRVLIYPAAAAAVYGAFSQPLLFGAIGLFCYIAGLTYAARPSIA
jgi:4-hydroxybenzoate polyprenyltransferase